MENSGWLYREEYDNFMIWPEEDGVENRLTMRFIAKEVHLGFPFTPYAGSVTIVSSVGEKVTWSLHCSEREEGELVEYADFPMDCHRVYSPLEFLMYSAGSLLIICFFCLIILYAVGFTWRKWGDKTFSVLGAQTEFDNTKTVGVFALALSCVVAFGDKINVYESPYFFPVKLEDFL